MADRVEAWDLFLKVAEFGSFSEAARRAGVSTGQVSKTISALEDQLAVRLFERTTRAVRLSEEGAARIDAARALVEAASRLESGDGAEAGLVGTLRISAPVIYGTRILAPLLAPFLSQYDRLSVRLTLTDRRVDLVNDGLDLALRIGTLSDTSLVGRRLSSIELRLLAAPALLERYGHPAGPAELSDMPCIIDLNLPEPRRWTFGRGEARETVRIDGRLETDSADVALEATRAGLGVGLIPDFCLDRARTGELVDLLPGWRALQRDVWLLWPSARHLAPRMRVLVDYLAAAIPETLATETRTAFSSRD